MMMIGRTLGRENLRGKIFQMKSSRPVLCLWVDLGCNYSIPVSCLLKNKDRRDSAGTVSPPQQEGTISRENPGDRKKPRIRVSRNRRYNLSILIRPLPSTTAGNFNTTPLGW